MSSKSWRLHILHTHAHTVKLLPIEWNVHIAITVISSHGTYKACAMILFQSQNNTYWAAIHIRKCLSGWILNTKCSSVVRSCSAMLNKAFGWKRELPVLSCSLTVTYKGTNTLSISTFHQIFPWMIYLLVSCLWILCF